MVPCFNYAHFLPEALESVLRQSHPSWECIVVDDGSTDNTEAVVQSFVGRDRRYRYIYQRNHGLSAARNRGIGEAHGEYFQFLDADDLIESRKLERHARYLDEHGEVGIVYAPVRYFTAEPGRERRYSMREPDEPWMPQTSGRGLPVISALARTNFMAVNCPLVRRQVIAQAGRFDETLHALEDWDYWIRCATQGAWFQYLDEPDTYALVRHHATSMSKDAMRITRALIPLCQRALQSIPEAGARDLFAGRLTSARHALHVLQLRQDMPLRGLLNGFVLGVSEKRYRISLQCLLGLVLLPFIGKRRVAALLLDVSWSRVIRSYFSG